MKKITLSILSTLLFSVVWATDFTPGNLVVYRVGDGSAALTNGSTASFLDEYSPSGTLIQSITLPTSGTNMLTNGGTSTSEGQMTLSPDKFYLTFAGYNVAPGTASLSSTVSSTVNRKIMTVDYTSNIVDVLLSSTAYSANNIRGAVKKGNDFWASGTGSTAGTNGIQYFGKGTAGQVTSTSTNIRSVNIFNDQLYYSSAASTGYGIFKVGTGLPTASGNVSTKIIDVTSSGSCYGFSFNSATTICYIADDRTTALGGIQKWTTTDGTNWTLATTINPAASVGARGVTVDWSGTNPVIFVVGTDSKLYKVIDDGATTTGTLLASSSTNTAFRGVAFAPIRDVSNGISTPILSTMKLAGNILGFAATPKSDVNVYSVTGSRVATYAPAQSIELNLPKGIYIVRADNQTGKIMLK